jgi:hypothetical protein
MILFEPDKWINCGHVKSLIKSIPRTALYISGVREIVETFDKSMVFVLTKRPDGNLYLKYSLQAPAEASPGPGVNSLIEGSDKMKIQQVAEALDCDVWEKTQNRSGQVIYVNVATRQELTQKQYFRKAKDKRGIIFGSPEWNEKSSAYLEAQKQEDGAE